MPVRLSPGGRTDWMRRSIGPAPAAHSGIRQSATKHGRPSIDPDGGRTESLCSALFPPRRASPGTHRYSLPPESLRAHRTRHERHAPAGLLAPMRPCHLIPVRDPSCRGDYIAPDGIYNSAPGHFRHDLLETATRTERSCCPHRGRCRRARGMGSRTPYTNA